MNSVLTKKVLDIYVKISVDIKDALTLSEHDN